MELLKLIKLLPMLIMVGALSYAAYMINGLMTPPAPKAAAKKGDAAGDVSLLGLLEEVASPNGEGRGRDPFSRLIKPSTDPVAAKAQEKAAVDPYPAIVQNLDLGATFIQGKSQYAVIDGRLYKVGDRLRGQGEAGSLVLAKVAFHDVTLTAGGREYTLGYPDQLAASSKPSQAQPADLAKGEAALIAQDPSLDLIRMLLRSPLGGMGRSMLGAQGVRLPFPQPGGSMPERPPSP